MPDIRRMFNQSIRGDKHMAHLQAVRTTLHPEQNSYKQLTTYFDPHSQVAWGYMNAEPRPCFTGVLLREIVDWFGDIAKQLDEPDCADVNYVVVASAHPGVYNLGGDLNLFRQLIEARDRESLYKYAETCIRPLFLNALHLNRPNLKTITLVQGDALGGGFECALSGNVLIALPPYRFPTAYQIVMRGWLEIHHFLRRATKFIIAGVVLVWLLTNLPPSAVPASGDTLAGMIGSFLQPIFAPIGINEQLTITLIFGFVAKEIVIGALAVIYGLSGTALGGALGQQLDWVQAYSFMLFTLIYMPCISAIATLHSESKNIRFTAFSIGWSLVLAWLASFAFYQGARALGIKLRK